MKTVVAPSSPSCPEAVRTKPLVKDPEAWKRERPFRVAVIEQCTTGGTIYNAQELLRAALRTHTPDDRSSDGFRAWRQSVFGL